MKHFYAPIFKAEPNDGHRALFSIEQTLKASATGGFAEIRSPLNDFDIVTMNVDGFHSRVGHQDVHEVHGTVMTNRCVKNGHPMDIQEDLDNYMKTKKFNLSANKCKVEGCKSTPRPDCVLFGEGLPGNVWNKAERAVRNLRHGDVMLVIGTSNKVYPAAELPLIAKKKGASVYTFDIAAQEDVGRQIIGKSGETLPMLLKEIEMLLQ